jgi:hypothetical protein
VYGPENVPFTPFASTVLFPADNRAPPEPKAMHAGTANVDTVMIAGRVVKRGGKLLAAGLADKMIALQRSGDRILADFAALPRRVA